MSHSNPIHFVEVSVCGPHEGFTGSYVAIFIHRARSNHSYWVHSGGTTLRDASRYWRGVNMLLAFSRRLFPSCFRREVRYVPNR